MGSEIGVLIVDDSELIREVLRSIFQSDSQLEIIGVAANGNEALELTAKLRPDVIVMDVNMPEMSGLEATEEIMAYYPTPILILTSMDSAEVAFEALSKGALEVVEKPELDDEKCRELIGKVKLIAGVKVVTHIAGRRGRRELPESVLCERPVLEARRRRPPAEGSSEGSWMGKVIGIGSSTGGPQVLGQIFRALPIGFPASIMMVQHITEGFVSILTKWLDDSSEIRVKEAEDGECLAPGVAYIAPSNVHMELNGNRIALRDGPPLGGHRPSIDIMLSSLAKSCGKRGIGVILSGMGRDGAKGVKAIRDVGGFTIAQKEETCVVFGMPGAAVELDGVSRVLSPREIAAEMLHQVQEGERA